MVQTAALATGAVILCAALLALAQRQRRGPFAGLGAGGRLVVGGVFAMALGGLAIKGLALIALASLPHRLSAGLPTPPAPVRADEAEPAGPRPPAAAAMPYVWEALPAVAPAPPHNPTTPARVALGRRLFEDPQLSADGTLSCAGCHALREAAGADARPTAQGIGGAIGARNTPTVWNAALQARLFWDGRAGSLEEQAKGPFLNPLEMGMRSPADVEARVRAQAHYRPLFDAAFGPGTAMDFDHIAAAIAAYERTLLTPDTPYDRFVRGDPDALTAAQRRGMALFERIGCVACHRGPNFSDASLLGGQAPHRLFPAHPTPYAARYRLAEDRGGAAPGAERGVWRVPSLRNVALTGPWFHNGAVDDLGEAVRVMASAQLGMAVDCDPADQRLALRWSAQTRTLGAVERRCLGRKQVADLVAFLEALSSDTLRAAVRASP